MACGISIAKSFTEVDGRVLQAPKACKFLDENWDPKFTLIVVKKNHHTKFFIPGAHDNVPPVAPVCYAHLAAAQVGQFIKFDEMSETSSSHGEHTSAGSVQVQELPRLHEKVKSSMFFR
ncbi:protein argonaute 4B-like isoform X2 [Panicum miliaceum]|uniref:Protein argonaute 4B-like isoform X2 n=1 Tax=Panicum miliaceum TaxID=4540 RepID=A0A3L6QZX8_PANMI|nr:protein argonaute 4B-like isoform X2 [Panicum miliaceum]